LETKRKRIAFDMQGHTPVLLLEVLSYLKNTSGLFIDATFGAGGYSKAILAQNPQNKVIAVDKDPLAIEIAQRLVNDEPSYRQRLFPFHGSFSDLTRNHFQQFCAQHLGFQDSMEGKFDGIVFDLGVSSMQIDEGERGFSFIKNGDLDMRMNPSSENTLNAQVIINSFTEREIADILFQFGEEKFARLIAAKIVDERKKK